MPLVPKLEENITISKLIKEMNNGREIKQGHVSLIGQKDQQSSLKEQIQIPKLIFPLVSIVTKEPCTQ